MKNQTKDLLSHFALINGANIDGTQGKFIKKEKRKKKEKRQVVLINLSSPTFPISAHFNPTPPLKYWAYSLAKNKIK